MPKRHDCPVLLHCAIDHLNYSGKTLAPPAAIGEPLVKFLGLGAHRRVPSGPANVTIDSTNKLKLVLLGASAPFPDNSTIVYLMSLRSMGIPTLPTTLTNQPRAGVAGTTWPLVLSLPSTPLGKVAGSYNDAITLTLSPGSQ